MNKRGEVLTFAEIGGFPVSRVIFSGITSCLSRYSCNEHLSSKRNGKIALYYSAVNLASLLIEYPYKTEEHFDLIEECNKHSIIHPEHRDLLNEVMLKGIGMCICRMNGERRYTINNNIK